MSERVLKNGRVKVRLDCLCGSGLEMTGPDDAQLRMITDSFIQDHTNKEGHGLCSVRESANARRREQRQRMREWRRQRGR